MRVAVCDDLKESLTEIKEMINTISIVETVDTFSDIDAFYEELREEVLYDVVLMDIDWKRGKTGIDFAEELLKLCPSTKIIYVTAYTIDYVEDALLKTSNLSGFLMKPVKKELLEKNLEKVQRNKETTEGKLIVRYKSNVSVIPFNEIYYIESQLHKSNIILRDREYQCSERLSQINERLNGQFLHCHKSYLVNLQYIEEFRNNEILLNNGCRIPVSKKRYSDARKRFFEYVSERM